MNAPPPKPAPAFSLIELLVVMLIISLLVVLLLPAITGFSGSVGRRGAVTTVMNSFEQARVSALESGRPTYVLFWRRTFPETDALQILREPPDTSAASWTYEPLTRWNPLPDNILLHDPPAEESMLSVDLSLSPFDLSHMATPPPLRPGETLNVLAFNATGGVAFPIDKVHRKLILSEGTRDADGTETLRGSKGAGGLEIISVSRHTGRPQLDISTLP